MATFNAKPDQVEAVQFTQAMADGEAQVPEGIEHAAAQHVFRVRTVNGNVGIDPGEWVVTTLRGKVVLSDREFRRLYEPTGETNVKS
jgi:hypothetical protein